MLLKFVFCFFYFHSTYAIFCNKRDPKTDQMGECRGDYCLLMKFNVLTAKTEMPTILQGCYNASGVKESDLGCFKSTENLDSGKFHNATICLCNTDRCNVEILLNSAPNSHRILTCQHSTQGSCQGYACMTKFVQSPQGTSTFRTCNPHFIDTQATNARLNELNSGDGPQCVETLQYQEASGFFTENICSCYTDNCNAPANDAKFPALGEKTVDCAAQTCNGTSCVNMTDGTCKGQYCYESK